jgi:O-antigen/teichoic acid export membrane protein
LISTSSTGALARSAQRTGARSSASKIGSFAIGTAGSTILGFAIVPLLAWMYAPDAIGQFAILQSFIGLSALVGPAGFDHYYIRTFHDSDDPGSLLSRCFASSAIAVFSVMAILTASTVLSDGGGLLGRVFSTTSTPILQLIILNIAAAVLIRYWSVISRMEGRGLLFSAGQTLPRLVLVVMLVLSPVLNRVTFEFLVVAVLASQVVTLAGLWPFMRGSFSPAGLRLFPRGDVPAIARFAIPIVVGTVIVWVMSFFDRTLLSLLSTPDQLALYAIAASIAAAAGVLQSLFSTLWAPAIYEVVAVDDERGKKLTGLAIETVYFVIGATFCLAGLLAPLTRLVVPTEFDDVSHLVPACLSLPLLYVLGECTVTGAYVVKRTHPLMLASLAAGLTSLAVNLVLIETRGATGAAVALAVSAAVYFTLRTEVSVRTWFRFPRIEMYAGVSCCVTLSCLTAIHGKDYAVQLNLAWTALLTYVLVRGARSRAITEAVGSFRAAR